MDENVLRLRVGVFVVIALCILGLLIFLNSEGWTSQYTIYLKPKRAPGVMVGTPIRKNGILIGRVKKVTTIDEGVLLTLGINEGEKLYANEVASIGAESVLGDTGIEFLTMSAEERGAIIGNKHNVSKVAIKRNPSEVIASFSDLEPKIAQALAAIERGGLAVDQAGTGIKELTSSIQGVFENEDSEVKALITDFRQTAVKAEAALDNFNRIFENVNNVIGDVELKGKIKGALAEVPKIFQEVRVALKDVQTTVKSFGTIPENINATTENALAFSESLKSEGPEILEQVNSSLAGIDTFIDDIKAFTKTLSTLKNSDSSIAKIFNDTTLYDDIKETMSRIKESGKNIQRSSENVQRVTTKFEPLVDDARGFADQLNRNPGVLISGAIESRKGNNRYKGAAGKSGLFSR